ncbi:hypothetical protein ACFLRZ_01235 [Bacteroidota bacterium]
MDVEIYKKEFSDFIFKYQMINVLKKLQDQKKFDKLLQALEDKTYFENCTAKDLLSLRSLLMELKNDCQTVVDQIAKRSFK